MPSYLSEINLDILLFKVLIVFIIIQISTICLLFLIYLRNLFSNLLHQYVMEKYEYYIMEAALGKVDRKSPIFKTAPFIRNILRMIIINKIMSVGGDARKGLIELYKDLGFDERDKKLLNSSKWYHRLSAITTLMITKSDLLKDSVCRILQDTNLSVKVAAIKAISVLNIAEHINKVIGCMSTMPDWVNDRILPLLFKMDKRPYAEIFEIFNRSPRRVKRFIVPLLFEIDSEQALWDLTNNFNEYDFETQIAIVKSLHRNGNIEKILGFAENIMNSTKWELKSQLVKSMGIIHDESALPFLINGLDDKNWFVRYNSAIAIASFGEKGINILREFASQNSGFKSDISRYILELTEYGFLSEELKI
ncbi:MAG: HEAT repeat domain-containing protein [Myxococcota bacterium]